MWLCLRCGGRFDKIDCIGSGVIVKEGEYMRLRRTKKTVARRPKIPPAEWQEFIPLEVPFL